MKKTHYLDEIRSLDPERDHLRIMNLSTSYEFPWDTVRSLEFALFRTYAAPSISNLLDQTGEFYKRAQQRYDDTSLLISEIYEHGYDSERGRAALRNMNRQHGKFTISNEDFLYVASTFVFEPSRWLAQFGWRPLCEQEQLALFYFWRELAKRMHIVNYPATYAEFEQFNRAYERDHFSFAASNKRVGDATVDLFLGWFLPRALFPLGRPFIYAMMDTPLLAAFGFPEPPQSLRWLTRSSLKMRAWVVRMLPPRRHPRLVADVRRRSYPRGYTLDQLGPPTQDG